MRYEIEHNAGERKFVLQSVTSAGQTKELRTFRYGRVIDWEPIALVGCVAVNVPPLVVAHATRDPRWLGLLIVSLSVTVFLGCCLAEEGKMSGFGSWRTPDKAWKAAFAAKQEVERLDALAEEANQ